MAKGIASDTVMNIFLDTQGEIHEFNYYEILKLYILSSLLESGDIHIEEGKMLLQLLNDHQEILQHPKAVICFILKLVISICLSSMNG